MTVQEFITLYNDSFGGVAELPIGFWFSNDLLGELTKTQGCMFKAFDKVRGGEPISMSVETLGCGGGKFYCGFAPMAEYIPNFVSQKERYKDSPEGVLQYIEAVDVQKIDKSYIHFSRLDNLNSWAELEGVIFFAQPDVLSGLCTWVFYDNHSLDAVSSHFGSGCSATISNVVTENRKGGDRAFLGLFDPSARPYFESNVLSLSIPMSRFQVMLGTLRECSLSGTPAWRKIRNRIIAEAEQ